MTTLPRLLSLSLSLGLLLATPTALAQGSTSTLPTIKLDPEKVLDTDEVSNTLDLKATTEAERRYYQCLLEHLKGTQSDEAVRLIRNACQALHGA